MPAIRSFLGLSVLAACLAQAVADGHLGGEGQGEWTGQGAPPAGWGGDKGSDYGSSGWNDWQKGSDHMPPPHVPAPVAPIQVTTVTKHVTIEVPPVTVTVTKEGHPPPPPAPITVTVTSVKEGGKVTITSVHPTTITAPCTSVETKHWTEWQYAPPGCWCGKGSPPPLDHNGAPMWPWPAGDAPIFTTVIPNFMPGRSSIPASEAVVTGVTVLGPAPLPPAATSSGTAFSSFGNLPSNSAQPSEIAGFPPVPNEPPVGVPPPPAAETTTAAAASSSVSEPLGPAPPLPPLTAQAAVDSSSTTSTTSAESTTSISTTTATAAALETSAPAPTSSAEPEGPPGPPANGPLPGVDRPSRIDPATLDLKNAYTLGIGRRAPRPTVVA